MHKGEYIGNHAAKQKKRILILGESHHISNNEDSPNREPGKVATYDTKEVVQEYLENYNNHAGEERKETLRFFDNIVRAFGIDPDVCRTNFWNGVYFGNYIDVLCGVRDSAATRILKLHGKREELNNKLFSFIEKNEIDIVFCFSRKAYNNLPPVEVGDSEDKGNVFDSHRIDKCVYCKGQRNSVTVSLSKPVTIYGLKHPSQGFSYRRYQDKIAEIVQKHGLSL